MGIDLKSSYMIGDMQKDIDAGRTAECKIKLVATGPERGDGITNADYTAADLMQAVQWLLNNE